MTITHEHHTSLQHAALFYSGDEEFAHATAKFVADGLRAGEPVLVAAPAAHLDLLRSALGGSADSVRFEDMTSLGRNPSCILPVIQDWSDEHDGRARIVGEPIWPGRSDAEVIESTRHEALINLAFADSELKILCPYDAGALGAHVVGCAERTHPAIDTPGGPRASARYGDPWEVFRAADWPLSTPGAPIAEMSFTEDLRAVRSFAAGSAASEILGPERLADFVLALNEVATNVVKHGRGRGNVRIWCDEARVVGEVSGPGLVTEAAAGRRRPPPEAVSGRGLWLVNQLCDLVELRTDLPGTTVRVHMAPDSRLG